MSHDVQCPGCGELITVDYVDYTEEGRKAVRALSDDDEELPEGGGKIPKKCPKCSTPL